jgi:hypothetical protein
MEKQMKNAIKMAMVFGMVSFLGISLPKVAFGDDAIKPLLGLDLGFNAYNSSTYTGSGGTKFTYGGRAGVRMESLEAALAYRMSKLESDDTNSTSIDATYILGDFRYRMPMGGGAFTAGIEAGSAKVSLNYNISFLSIEGDSQEKFAFGPVLGYEMPLSEHIELGASVDYLTIFTSEKIHSFGFLANASYVF